MSRIVQRSIAMAASQEAGAGIPQLIRSASVEHDAFISPAERRSLFRDSIDDELESDSGLRICCTPLSKPLLMGGCSANMEARDTWFIGLPYNHTESFHACTPIRTYKDTSQSFKCRYMGASVHRSVDKCTLSAS
ncbi:hypothetical protein BgAZ_303000 [Babesia gibsoni]|uniref:Uncharacterized protein n=1 Tax=Babesia gibsoni TaxID=33632 RepID=A0AAD8LR07_BABGI|nr:hypothetical protein BgAZ_303000 [Babesia gibsoni]